MPPEAARPRVVVSLTASGRAALGGGAAVAALGLLSVRPLIVAWGAIWVGLLLLHAARVLRTAAHLRCGALRARWHRRGSQTGWLLTGRRIPLALELEPRGDSLPSLRLSGAPVEVWADASLQVELDTAGIHRVDRRTRIEATVTPRAAGRRGIAAVTFEMVDRAGLFALQLTLPAHAAFDVLPAARPGAAVSARARQAGRRPALAAVMGPFPGDGGELRQLRERLPGDPLRHVDWKATARWARLVVREFEPSPDAGVLFVLDASWPMREGPSGVTPFDVAAGWVFATARQLATRGVELAALGVDRHPVLWAPWDAGASAVKRCAELVVRLADPETTGAGRVHAAELLHWVHALAAALPTVVPVATGEASAEDPAHLGILLEWAHGLWPDAFPRCPPGAPARERLERLRVGLRRAGIAPPAALRPIAGAQCHGLVEALRWITRRERGGRSIAVATNLADPAGLDDLVRAVAHLRRDGHELSVFLAPLPDPGGATADDDGDLRTAAALAERHAHARALRLHGAQVFDALPRGVPA